MAACCDATGAKLAADNIENPKAADINPAFTRAALFLPLFEILSILHLPFKETASYFSLNFN